MVTHDEAAGQLGGPPHHARTRPHQRNPTSFPPNRIRISMRFWSTCGRGMKRRGHIESTHFNETQWARLISTMTRIGLVECRNGEEHFTPAGEARARNCDPPTSSRRTPFHRRALNPRRSRSGDERLQVRAYPQSGSDGPHLHPPWTPDGVPARQPDPAGSTVAWRGACSIRRGSPGC